MATDDDQVDPVPLRVPLEYLRRRTLLQVEADFGAADIPTLCDQRIEFAEAALCRDARHLQMNPVDPFRAQVCTRSNNPHEQNLASHRSAIRSATRIAFRSKPEPSVGTMIFLYTQPRWRGQGEKRRGGGGRGREKGEGGERERRGERRERGEEEKEGGEDGASASRARTAFLSPREPVPQAGIRSALTPSVEAGVSCFMAMSGLKTSIDVLVECITASATLPRSILWSPPRPWVAMAMSRAFHGWQSRQSPLIFSAMTMSVVTVTPHGGVWRRRKTDIIGPPRFLLPPGQARIGNLL